MLRTSPRGGAGLSGSAPADPSDLTFAPALPPPRPRRGFDTVIVTAGLFATQEQLEADVELARRLTTVNFSHTVVLRAGATFSSRSRRWLAAVCPPSPEIVAEAGHHLRLREGGSPPIPRGRSSLSPEGRRVLTIKPGFVRTGMTQGPKVPPFAGSRQPSRKTSSSYREAASRPHTPSMWRWVMAVIKRLPRAVMRRSGSEYALRRGPCPGRSRLRSGLRAAAAAGVTGVRGWRGSSRRCGAPEAAASRPVPQGSRAEWCFGRA